PVRRPAHALCPGHWPSGGALWPEISGSGCCTARGRPRASGPESGCQPSRAAMRETQGRTHAIRVRMSTSHQICRRDPDVSPNFARYARNPAFELAADHGEPTADGGGPIQSVLLSWRRAVTESWRSRVRPKMLRRGDGRRQDPEPPELSMDPRASDPAAPP